MGQGGGEERAAADWICEGHQDAGGEEGGAEGAGHRGPGWGKEGVESTLLLTGSVEGIKMQVRREAGHGGGHRGPGWGKEGVESVLLLTRSVEGIKTQVGRRVGRSNPVGGGNACRLGFGGALRRHGLTLNLH